MRFCVKYAICSIFRVRMCVVCWLAVCVRVHSKRRKIRRSTTEHLYSFRNFSISSKIAQRTSYRSFYSECIHRYGTGTGCVAIRIRSYVFNDGKRRTKNWKKENSQFAYKYSIFLASRSGGIRHFVSYRSLSTICWPLFLFHVFFFTILKMSSTYWSSIVVDSFRFIYNYGEKMGVRNSFSVE